MLKGAIHTHSTFSDGEFTLAELREIFTSAGCSFVAITDHADSFEPEKLEDYVAECASLSDDHFRFIPSLEYTCVDKMHILGYGVTSLAHSVDPQEVIRHIQSHRGIAVIAHPRDAAFSVIETFESLPDGIEIWNTKYDGRYAPRPGTIRLLERLRQRKPDLHAFYGLDLHWKQQYRGLLNVVNCTSPLREEVLAALARGDYFASKDDLSLPSSGEIPEALVERFAASHERSTRMRNFMTGAKKALDRAGIAVPPSLKARLRRMF